MDPLTPRDFSVPGPVDLSAQPDIAAPPPDMASSGGGMHVWSKRFGADGEDQAFSVATDAAGNLIVAGSYQGTVDFGGGPHQSRGDYDVFVAKYAPDGAFQWSRSFGGTGDDEAYGVAVDGQGNIVVGGAFTGSTDFGGGPLTSSGGYDMILARYGADGKFQWQRKLGGATDDAISSVSCDSGGAVSATGYFTGTANLGGGVLSAVGELDAFLLRYGADGSFGFAKAIGGSGEDFGSRVAAAPDGGAVVTGYFNGKLDLGGGVTLTSNGKSDIFVARYGAAGALAFAKGFGGAEDDSPSGVAVDSAGNALLAGRFQGSINFGGGALSGADPLNLYLARLGPGGAHLWSKRFGGNAPGVPGAIAVSGGALVVTGSFNDQLDLGGGALQNGGIYVAKYNLDGAHLWSRRFGGLQNTYGNGASVDSAGRVALCGAFQGSLDFGGGTLSSAGGLDAYLVRLAP